MQQSSPTDPLLAHDALISQPSPAVPKPQDPSRTTSCKTPADNSCPICNRGPSKIPLKKAVQSFQTTATFLSGIFAISPDGRTIVCGCIDGSLVVYCIHCGQEVGQWRGSTNEFVLCVAFSPDGALIASGGDDKTVTIRDAKNRYEDDTAVLHTITGHEVDVRCVAFSPTQQQIASSDSSGLVLLHALPRQGRKKLVLLRHVTTHRYTPSLVFSPDGSQLAIGRSGGLDKLHLATGEISILDGDFSTHCMSYSPNGDVLARGGNEWAVTVHDALTFEKKLHLSCPVFRVTSVAFSPDGTMLAVASDATASIYEADTGYILLSFRHPSRALRLAFSPDGNTLVVSGEEFMHLHPITAYKQKNVATSPGFLQFKAALPPNMGITDNEAEAAFRASECGAQYAFPTWHTTQQRTVAAAVNEIQEHDGLFALFASRVGQYTLPSSTTKALYVIWRMKYPDWTLDGKKREVLVKSIKEFCEKRLGVARTIAVRSTRNVDDRFTRFIASPNNLQFKDDSSRDAMHESWVSFCEQAPSTEGLDAIVEGFMRRVRKDEDGNASFDAAVLPLYWPKYTKAGEVVLVNALRDTSNLEQCVSIKTLYNWFQHKMGRRGLSKATTNKLYTLWKLFLAENHVDQERVEEKLLPFFDRFVKEVEI